MRGPRRPPSRPKGFEDVPELSPEEVERRVDVRGGGSPPVPAPVERPVRDLRRARSPRRTVGRESILLLGLVAVGLVTVGLLLPQGPLTAGATGGPAGSAAGVGSVAPPTSGPVQTPSLVTLMPIGSPSGEPATPAVSLEPTPTLAPGQTPGPTPRPTRTPAPTKTPTPSAANLATVIVTLVVVTDSGGSAAAKPSDWTMHVDIEGGLAASPNDVPGSSAGVPVSVPAGKGYRVRFDSARPDYAAFPAPSEGCSRAYGGGGLAAGMTVTCTITRDDRPRLRVITDVVGGSASASDVSVTVDGANATPDSFAGSETGVVVVVGFDLTYSVAQPDLPGYTKSSSGACAGFLGLDEEAECTFTFTYEPPPTGAAGPAAPFAWHVPAWGAVGLGGRRRWTQLRNR